jgi:hypothetical protein
MSELQQSLKRSFSIGLKAERGLAITARDEPGEPTPPQGFVFIVDQDGRYLKDADGVYLREPA